MRWPLLGGARRAAPPAALMALMALLIALLPAAPASAGPLTITYEVRGWGNATDLEDFAARAAETYADPAGWALGGSIVFVRVGSGGSFTLWLSAPENLPKFSSGCSTTYSCRVGRNVIINEARFRGGSSAWNATGASLRDYQHMVVNHETGHWLGFGHTGCPAAGAPAPVMQQQSKTMAGCWPNPRPTPAEREALSRAKGVPVLTPGVGGGLLDPGWTQVPGSAFDIAFTTIAGGWEMFHVGTDNAVYRRSYRGATATDWTVVPGMRAKRIAATTSPDGRAELFHIGMDDAIYHNWERVPGGDLGTAVRFDGTYATAVATARSGTAWEMYHVGAGGLIWRYSAVEGLWRPLTGTWASELAAATSDDGRVELFHIGSDQQTWHAWQTAPGAGFTGPAGPGSWQGLGDASTAVAAANGVGGSIEVYTIGSGGTIWRLPPGGYPGNWQQVIGAGTGIAATTSPDGRIEVLHRNSAGAMYHAWQRAPGVF